MDLDIGEDAKVRRRNQTACEACRTTKIRCQSSEQPGVCKKCLESKRECISRTTPRSRRSKRQIKTQGAEDSEQLSSATSSVPKASSTFSIDFAVPSQPEVDNNFDVLREMHEAHVDQLLTSDEDDFFDAFDLTTGNNSSTPATSASAPSNSIESLHAKPLFNLTSAESLLESFKHMLNNFPCIVLEQDDTVSHLAKTRPFVLLAILAAASGSKTLQGHSLYDEEFRKVLGLKFVAGGERTLELLQGILIYCSWYPFHLRPKNKQVFHYIRMCTDLITDLELDQDPSMGMITDPEVDDQQLDGIRAYLAHCYIITTFVVSWRRYKNLGSCFSPWTHTCCSILERNAQNDNDHVLVAYLRLANINHDASEVIHAKRERIEQQGDLLLLGLETQSTQLKQNIPANIADMRMVKLAIIFTDVFLKAGPLSAISRPHSFLPSPLPPDVYQLKLAVPSLAMFLREILLLEQSHLIAFTALDWGRLVLVLILSFRISFPLPNSPGFDHIWARNEVQVGSFLEQFCVETDLTDSSRKVDVLSASRVVMRVVKDKYDKKLLRESSQGMGGCPMLDGSLSQYLPLWDADLNPIAMDSTMKEQDTKAQQPVFHDLWATMTMSWAADDDQP